MIDFRAVAFVVLTQEEVERLLPMPECIDLMAETLTGLERGEFHLPLRVIAGSPGVENVLGLMPAYRSEPEACWGLKVIALVPGNPVRGLDTHQGAVVLFDGETGEVRAVMNASAITAIRTAAVSGVATRLLAREDASRLAIIGAGVQARKHLEAIAVVRRLEWARVTSARPEHAQDFAAEAATRYPFPVEAAASAEEALRGADIVVTATSSAQPVLRHEWLAEGAHVNAVGACFPTARELDTTTVAAASLFVDRRESALNEAGDVLIPIREGAIGPDHVRAELGEVLAGKAPGRTSPDELTVFESLGIAVEDLASAQFLLRRARETGAGVTVEF